MLNELLVYKIAQSVIAVMRLPPLVTILCFYCLHLNVNSNVLSAADASIGQWTEDDPKLDIGEGLLYHGLLRENETEVEVTPGIKAKGPPPCAFVILPLEDSSEIPFEVVVSEVDRQQAKLFARKTLDCETKKGYHFQIAVQACNGHVSPGVEAVVSVLDVNEHAPEWYHPSYEVEAEEGKMYSELLRVEASDRDCSPKFGDICKYEILTIPSPFIITADGVLKNSEPLTPGDHILSVVAYDCGMKRSRPVQITCHVKATCHVAWKGIEEQVEYTPGSGVRNLYPGAHLELCGGNKSCEVSSISTSVSLVTSHIGKGCDRDTHSLSNRIAKCGGQDGVVVLPSSGPRPAWLDTIPSQDESVYKFDGQKDGVRVPESFLDHNFTHQFTVGFWMKHKTPQTVDKHHKEHIFCSADDHKMNRHHYGLFIRNCRLIFLLRRDFSEGDLNTFRPAEWRWKIPEVCDGEWHHYGLLVSFPQVRLVLDGKEVEKKPEVIDDWPLHPSQGIKTTFTIGACWQSSESGFQHMLTGYLGDLYVIRGRVEDPKVLTCLSQCKEQISSPSQNTLSSRLNEVSLDAGDVEEMNGKLRSIGYVNDRAYPTPGLRPIRITTQILCKGGETLSMDPIQSGVKVLSRGRHSITISGSTPAHYSYEDIRTGVPAFPDIQLSSAIDGEDIWRNGEPESAMEDTLETCTIHLNPPMVSDQEHLEPPHDLLEKLNIHIDTSDSAVTLSGIAPLLHYRDVLRGMQYVNSKPAYYLDRQFQVSCMDLDSRFVSNDFLQVLSIIHPTPESPATNEVKQKEPQKERKPWVAHSQSSPQEAEFHHPETSYVLQPTNGSSTVVIIAVVCLGALVSIVVFGVIRIRAATKKSQHEALDQDMAWDDSSLNITVNPMDDAKGLESPETESDSDSYDSGSGREDDDEDRDGRAEDEEEDDEVNGERRKQRLHHEFLEWDHGPLNI